MGSCFSFSSLSRDVNAAIFTIHKQKGGLEALKVITVAGEEEEKKQFLVIISFIKLILLKIRVRNVKF
jgi:hypothetical protein